MTPTAAADIDNSAFDRDGYLTVRRFLPDHDFQVVRENVDRFIRDVVPSMPDTDAFYQDKARPETLKQLGKMQIDPFFEALQADRRWFGVAEQLLGERPVPMGVEWFNKPPCTEHPTPPHQDNYYFKLAPPSVLTMWLALERIDDENGCIRYLPGSHRTGIRPHAATEVVGFSQGITDWGPDDEAREEAMRLEPNDLIIHHGNTVHRADPNRSSTRHRPALALVFHGISAQKDESARESYQQDLLKLQRSKGLDV